jgi:ribosomal protein L7/L12
MIATYSLTKENCMVSDQDFFQLRGRVTRLEEQIEFLYNHSGVTFPPEIDHSEPPKVIELLKQGKKVDAIIIYGELNRLNLAEAKQAVEAIQRKLGIK